MFIFWNNEYIELLSSEADLAYLGSNPSQLGSGETRLTALSHQFIHRFVQTPIINCAAAATALTVIRTSTTTTRLLLLLFFLLLLVLLLLLLLLLILLLEHAMHRRSMHCRAGRTVSEEAERPRRNSRIETEAGSYRDRDHRRQRRRQAEKQKQE